MMIGPVVIALDPGETTGWAYLSNGTVKLGQSAWFEAAEWLHDCVLACVKDHTPATIVAESYTVTQATIRKSREYAPLELIGVARYLTRRYLTSELVLQSPADAKSFVDDDKLKQLGWYIKGQDHARDAARHLALYMVRAKLLDPRHLVEG